jgi:tetratricopeptide (TPR) repeat protein
MSLFQILMLAATLFFAYQIYRHVQNLGDGMPEVPSRKPDPGPSAAMLVDRADSAYQRGELGEARRLLEEAYGLNEADTEVLNKLAFVTAKSGERREAIELYERSLELDENDDLTHNAIASLYRAEGALERAQDHYLKALEIDDAYAQTFYNYANLLVDMHERDEAGAMYKRALELDPGFAQARDALEELEKNDER